MSIDRIKVYRDLMGNNERWARENRTLLRDHGLAMVNLIGSPGSGKTALLERMVEPLHDELRFAVLEGDIETTRDAERLDRLDVPVSQLLSGGACHLEAKLVNHALADLALEELELVFVENVGNMVCPAEFDVGEHAKIAVLSVTEGEDKPLKYPLLFREARAALLTKIDLLPHLSFDREACLGNLRAVNADLPVFCVSAAAGEGMDAWMGWLLAQVRAWRGAASADGASAALRAQAAGNS
ncbi:MAG: hydrogenase nickel incorporation protein HypB [Gammaproteobacteria bacterium]